MNQHIETPETTLRDRIIATLAKTYDLVYVEQGDGLTPEQVSDVVNRDAEALNDSIWEWSTENAAISARTVALEAVQEYERHHEVPEDFDTSEMAFGIEETIRERDTSNPLRDLAEQTSDVLLRVNVISEDDAPTRWNEQPIETYLKKAGLPVTARNIETMDGLIAETPSEVHMAYAVFTAPIKDLLDTMGNDKATVTVTNPDVVLGNPFTGGYWSAPFEVTMTFAREDLVTDRDAFGWSVDDTYGGFITEGRATFSATQNEDAE